MTTRLRLSIGVILLTLFTCGTITFGEYFTVPTYTLDYVIPSSGANLGPTAPSNDINAHCGGLGFDAANEVVNIPFEVPNCWDGASDIVLKIYWCNEDGDVIQNGETVKFVASWRSIDWGTEGADNGTVATDSSTHTQSGVGTAAQTLEEEITIPRTGGNQPISVGDSLSIIINRDTGADNYSGKAIIDKFEVSFQSTTPHCDHQ